MARTEIGWLEEFAEAGYWEWSADGDSLCWSPELSRIYGVAPGQAPTGYQGFMARVFPADRELTEQAVQRALAEHRDVEYQHRIVRSDGEVRVLRSLVHVDTDRGHEVVRLSGVCQDVTERVAMEEHVRRLQGLASAGTVAAGLSHDLNNLVGGILLLCGALTRSPAERTGELVSQIQEMAKQTSVITTRIQRLARTEPPTGLPIEVACEIECIATRLRELLSDRYVLQVHAAHAAVLVRVDAVDLERVLWNLVINARDAQPDGGAIDVRVDRVTVIDHEIHRGEWCRITVRDYGCGMDESTAARLFEPFFTTKGAAGNGLGLVVVHDIVESAGGFVSVESRRGAGTKIHIHLPPVA